MSEILDNQPLDLSWTGTQFIGPDYWRTPAREAALDANLITKADSDCVELRNGLARALAIPPQWLAVGSGSANVIDALLRWLAPQGIVDIVPNFKMARLVAQRDRRQYQAVPVIERDTLIAPWQPFASLGVTILSSPRNPFGYAFTLAQVAELARSTEGTVIVDEAYVEFSETSCLTLVATTPNLILTRTFSKAWGLSGLRVGYAIGQSVDDRLRRDYLAGAVCSLAQRTALAALEHAAFMQHTVQLARSARSAFVEFLRHTGAGRAWASDSNFVFFETDQAASWAARLLSEGITVARARELSGYPSSCPDGLRITVPPLGDLPRLQKVFRQRVSSSTRQEPGSFGCSPLDRLKAG